VGHEGQSSVAVYHNPEDYFMSTRKSFRKLATSVLYLGGSILAGAALLVSAPASAALCASTTSCTLNFTQGNTGSGFGTGNFGTLGLSRSGSTVTVTIDLAANFFVIGTGFPGAVGFSDSLGGGLTMAGFPANYSGFLSHATSDLHFDGFGFFNNAGATTAPSAGSANALNVISFTVTGAGLNDVNQLLNLANPAGGDGLAYFVVDAINRNTSGAGAGNTGLLAVTGGGGGEHDVPEPKTLALLGLGLFSLTLMRRHNRA
jgi:hypothetical protein